MSTLFDPPVIDLAETEVLLDGNESPIGVSPRAVERVTGAAPYLHRYPRGLVDEVTALTAAHLGVCPEEVLLTSGVDEAVDLALSIADRAWVVRPGFDGYVERAGVAGIPVREIALDADWQPPGGPVAGLGRGDLVLLAQPNNPTGNLFAPGWLLGVHDCAQFVFLDETYVEFSSRGSVLPGRRDDPGLIVFRSFSKAMGLAGVRLGCLVADPALIAGLRARQRYQPVDAVSLHAVAGTLEDPSFVRRLAGYVAVARPALVRLLTGSALFAGVRDTETNFVLARPHPGAAAAVLAAFAGEGIRVKPCDGLGLPGWLRISVGSPGDLHRLEECLRRCAPPADRGEFR